MAYADFVAELKAQSKGTNYSKSDLNSLAMAMFNDAEASIPVFVKKGDGYEERKLNPGMSLRNQLIAPILKTYGVDRAEMSSLPQVQTTRAGGEALADFSLALIKQYISKTGLGRKLTLPMCSPNETVQSISCIDKEAEESATTKIVRVEDGSYQTTPTGNIVLTQAHEKLKVANRVPKWLKKTTPANEAKS